MTDNDTLREQLRELVLTDEEKETLEQADRFEWPPDEYTVPPDPQHDGETTQMLYKEPYGAKFVMPKGEHDFPCNECDGQLGPWVHKRIEINIDACHGDDLYVNLLHVRERYCTECDYTHFNSYAIGHVHFDQSNRGILRFDHFS